MKRKSKKYNKFKNNNKFKINKISITFYPKVIKSLLIFLMFILLIFAFNLSIKDLFNFSINKKEENNDWIKNRTEFINYFLPNINGENKKILMVELKRVQNYLSLKVFLKDENCALNLVAKEKLRNELEKKFKKNFSLVKNIFIKYTFSFGNQIIAFNNVIFYCEILGIKNIILNSKYNKWYIKNEITTDKIHISFLPRNKIDCLSPETFCAYIYPHLFYPRVIKPVRRSLILKDEILSNLPKTITKENDLYIYIRSGDMFNQHGNIYIPIPYCFYERVLNNFKFEEIYIISVDDKNPIIGKLLSNYPKIKHKLNSVEEDISTLIYAYNLINSVSSFTQAAISFNDKLINLFEYEVYKLEDKIQHFHYDIDKLNRKFNIYRMKPSEYYFRKIYIWKNDEKQRNLLFNESCKYDFRKTIYEKTFFD